MEIDGVSQAYWEGARRGRLVLQRCGGCGRVRHYPQPLCPGCHSFAVEHFEAAGRGTVHSWTVAHHAFSPEVRDEVPYVLVTVDLDESVRLLGRLAGTTPPRIGLPVTVAFEPAGAERPIPVFTPVTPRD
ncbi:MAG TPA: OB-fold domain-containing protein [Pseudonocardia sp.]|jgi:hypothetical protein